MLVLLSHVLAFSVLFIAAISDLKTTEVPDILPAIGVLGGIILHAAASYRAGVNWALLTDTAMMLNTPLTWFQTLGDPLAWSIAIGVAFSVYGWSLYFLGMWGGADAFAMSVLGFAAPYSLSGMGVMHGLNLFVNIMLVGFVYTLLYAFYKSLKNKEVLTDTWTDIKDQELRISVEVILAAAVSFIGSYTGVYNGLTYFIFLVFLIFLYRFLKNIQHGLMTREVSVSDLEGGEVLARDEENGGKVVGITEEDIQSFETETVTVREGIRFIPVFPVALLITDIVGGGMYWVVILFS